MTIKGNWTFKEISQRIPFSYLKNILFPFWVLIKYKVLSFFIRILEYFILQRNIRVLGTSCNSLTHPKWIQPSELVIWSKSLSLCNNNKNRRKREMASKQRMKRCPGMRCLFLKFFFLLPVRRRVCRGGLF